MRDCFGGSKATPEFQGCWSEFRPPLQYGVLANSGFISNLDSYVALILKDHPRSTDLAGGWPDLINYELEKINNDQKNYNRHLLCSFTPHGM